MRRTPWHATGHAARVADRRPRLLAMALAAPRGSSQERNVRAPRPRTRWSHRAVSGPGTRVRQGRQSLVQALGTSDLDNARGSVVVSGC